MIKSRTYYFICQNEENVIFQNNCYQLCIIFFITPLLAKYPSPTKKLKFVPQMYGNCFPFSILQYNLQIFLNL